MLKKLKAVIPPLKKETWWILIGYTISLFGTGMTEPYLILYLHQLRDISLSLSGLVIGLTGLAGVVAVPISGMLSDHFGEKRVFLLVLLIDAFGRIAYASAVNTEWALIAAILSGVGEAGSWNVLSVILANSEGKQQGVNVFGVAFALQNFGSGSGAALSGIFLQTHTIASFQIVFILDAITFLLFALFSYRRIRYNQKQVPTALHEPVPCHRSVHTVAKSDKFLIALSVGYLLIATVMTGFTSIFFPQWVTKHDRLPVQIIGQAFLANSLVIVIGQFIILRITKHVQRTKAVAAAMLIFALGYSIVLISGFLPPRLASLNLICSLAITAIGETLLFSNLPTLVNEIAPQQARGRYNSMINIAWQMGSILGPVIIGMGLSMHLDILMLMILISAFLFLIPFFIGLGKHISARHFPVI